MQNVDRDRYRTVIQEIEMDTKTEYSYDQVKERIIRSEDLYHLEAEKEDM